jgi:hypothetical protein
MEKQGVITWGEGDESLKDCLKRLISQGYTIVCVVPTTYSGGLLSKYIQEAEIIVKPE